MLNTRESNFIKNLSEQEICELKEAFNIFDNDSDGSISKKKLIILLSSLKQHPKEKELNELLKSIGICDLSKINFNQFLIIMARRTQTINFEDDKYLIKLFNQMDRNKNGRISIHEIKYIITHSSENVTKKEIEFLMREVDNDGDGLISFDEFLTFMKK